MKFNLKNIEKIGKSMQQMK